MSKTEFTPGPWEITAQEGEYCLVNQCGAIKPEICSICTIYCTQYDQVRANAALIATAPELYAALNEICEDCGNRYCVETCRSAGCNISEILKKARGEA